MPLGTTPILLAAQVVVKNIEGLGLAASNREYSRLTLGETEVENRFAALDAGHTQANQSGDLNTYSMLDAPSIKAAAALVAQHKAGNCEEQSALAFDMLAKLGIRPLELMGVYLQDHVLVVAGRIAGTPMTPAAWNWDAVVCDPWAKRAYFATSLADEMQTIKSVTKGETRMSQKFELKPHAAW